MVIIEDNILKVKKRISLICSKINKDPDSITVVAVSKARSVEQIKETIEAGITDIGENRVQEAVIKYKSLTLSAESGSAYGGNTQHLTPIKWHMVGHLQTNKVKDAVKIFDLIHSVDSLRLAEELNRQAARIDKIQDILIEVKTSQETAKFGLKPEEAIEVIKEMANFKNINIKGLMTIAPLTVNPGETRPFFRMLRELRDKIKDTLPITHYPLPILSMGMTDDFEVAIEEGSNIVRLGRVIFD